MAPVHLPASARWGVNQDDLADHLHVIDDPNKPIIEQGLNGQGANIGEDVWIGAGVVILDGVKIGNGAVIGAGAIVTKDVGPGQVAVGVPARVIRDRREPMGSAKETEIQRR